MTDKAIPMTSIAIAGAIAVIMSEGYFDLWDLIVGVILLSVMHTWVELEPDADWHNWPFTGICALMVILIIGWAIDAILIEVERCGLMGWNPRPFEKSLIGTVSFRDFVFVFLWLGLVPLVKCCIKRRTSFRNDNP